MVIWLINCVAVCVMSVLLCGVVIPQILLIAFRRSLFDEPDERKIHTSLVPRLGGMAFAPVIMFSMVLLIGLSLSLHEGLFPVFMTVARPLAFGFCAVMLLYLVGIADDLIGIRYRAKFVVQILCGVLFIAGGLCLGDLHGFVGITELPEWISWPLTVFVVVYIVNAINLIDGIDGLASGLSGIACLYFGLMFFMMGDYVFATVSFATLGVLIPFFYYNVFGDPARQKKIFMGDTGSLTIGVILSFLSLHMSDCDLTPSGANPVILAFAPLIVPCFDVVRVYLHRVRNGRNPFLPDKNHIHHKLLAIGLPQRVAMVSILSVSLLLTLINVRLSTVVNINILVVGDILLWTIVNIWLTRRARKINNPGN
ncbi:MAG: undecaprenyl/decaprenyl-phosphate alpha-N-acetylglucosaminyl 1-phosphate transferase [Paramuribaculum sp.]|nr:undecaprenyl/decaprenyl-phosphate alpha-N-acetylglucosaminyl 1-phosphate transferase [Paramuribaculum sp.]